MTRTPLAAMALVLAACGSRPAPTGATAPLSNGAATAPARPAADTDRDADGVVDRADTCPDAPEDADDYEDGDGCPDPDNDRDGFLDAADRCPQEPEVYGSHYLPDGCPD